MVTLKLQIDEITLEYWKKRAEQENISVEQLVQNLMAEPAHQEDANEYEDWLKIGLFAGRKGFTGRHADEILNNEYTLLPNQ